MPDEDLRGFADGELLDRLFPDSAGPIGQWFGLPHSRRVAFGLHSVRGKLELDGGRLWKLHKAAQDASRKRCDAATVMLRQAELVAAYHPDPLTKAQTLEAKAWDGLVLREKFADTALRLTVVAAPGISKAFAQKIAGGLISIRMLEPAGADLASVSDGTPAAAEPEGSGVVPTTAGANPAPRARKRAGKKYELEAETWLISRLRNEKDAVARKALRKEDLWTELQKEYSLITRRGFDERIWPRASRQYPEISSPGARPLNPQH